MSDKAEKDVADFLSRVVPWPADNGGSGFINVHWLHPNKKGMPGHCVNSAEEMLLAAAEIVNKKANAFFCLSRQANAGIRKKENALELKAVWLDVDVKDKDDAYKTLKEAGDAVAAFVERYKLPAPTAVVASGGGLHVYWVSDRPLSVEEWQAYASGLHALALEFGLKFDPSVTIDRVRVLRIPGTKNFKTDPPKPVKLASLKDDYDFATDLAVLKDHATDEPVHKHRDFGPANLKVADAFRDMPVEDFGIYDPVTVEQVAAVCPWIKQALDTGGAGFSEPEWSNTTLLATVLEDGKAAAHRLADKHTGYSKASTNEKFRSKIKARDTEGIGPPRCDTISKCRPNGKPTEACKSCPLFARKSSPLQLAREVPLNLALPGPTIDVDTIFGQVREGKLSPVIALRKLRNRGTDIDALLAAMNQNHAVIKYGSQIMVAVIHRDDISIMKVEDFHKMFANLLIHKETKRQDGTVATRAIKVSKSWFEWKDRRQYLGRGVVFEPGGHLEVENDMLNMWRGFGVEPKQGDWSLLRNHIRNVICSGNEDHFQYLIKWMAYGVQHPERPIGVAIALRGEEGAGKGFVLRNYGKLFGKHFKHVAHGEHLTGRFNAALAEACVVFLDEALWAGDRKGEQILKALVTEDTFQLERKFCDPIPVKNRLRIMIASNNQWIVPIGTRGRRYLVLDVSDQYADESNPAHAAYWEPLQAQFGDLRRGRR